MPLATGVAAVPVPPGLEPLRSDVPRGSTAARAAPPSLSRQARLTSRILSVSALSPSVARGLYSIYAAHYDHAGRERFEADLFEKDWVILLLDASSGEPRGFSTQKLLRARVRGIEVRAIFSGDTIIDRSYWGEQELVRAWCRFAGAVWAREPLTRLFWFLICKGYRTYLYLPLFFRDYCPRYDAPAAPFEAAVLDSLASGRYPRDYRPEAGLLVFPESHGQLNASLAETPAGRLDDPRVRFFLSRNPGYARGDELVCLTEISERNMKSLAQRSFLEGRALGLEALAGEPAAAP